MHKLSVFMILISFASFTAAEVRVWSLHGTGKGIEINDIRRGGLRIVQAHVDHSGITLGPTVFYDGSWGPGPKPRHVSAIMLKLQSPVQIGGRNVSLTMRDADGAATSWQYWGHDTDSQGLMDKYGWPQILQYNSYSPYVIVDIPDSIPAGKYTYNVGAKFCVGVDSYDEVYYWNQEYNYACYDNTSYSDVTFPLTITVVNQCTASSDSIELDHGTLIKGVNTEGHSVEKNINISCDGPTNMNVSFQGTTAIHGIENSVSLGDGWSSQLGVEVDDAIYNSDISFNVSNLKNIKIKSVIHGEQSASPGEKKSSGSTLVMRYN